jgi:hypothetical protein
VRGVPFTKAGGAQHQTKDGGVGVEVSCFSLAVIQHHGRVLLLLQSMGVYIDVIIESFSG